MGSRAERTHSKAEAGGQTQRDGGLWSREGKAAAGQGGSSWWTR